MEESQFVLNSVQLMYYKCHKVNLRIGGSYIDSPDWIKKKAATMNPKNKDVKCFRHVVTVALSYEKIIKNLDKVFNIEPFINKYKWKGINYPSKVNDRKSFGEKTRQLLLIFCILKKKKYVQLIFQKLIRIEKNKIFY